MKFEISYTWDSDLMKQRVRCFFKHNWESHQVVITSHSGMDIVVAFKICKRCAASKLIHILI